ncbi:MAG TPA: carboxypeptidase-like regulatory domain-containing protein [Pyrinomonadaceae bacterium]|nr:carboxypeptidase-like regulatory domain-containing protein [Pyrinomonadaceae bacterium]
MMKRLLCISFAFILAGAVLAIPGRSSHATARKLVLTGTVYDRNHALILSSQVVAQNAEGKNYWAVPNGDGVYKIELPRDEYRVEANAPGFCPRRIDLVRMLKTSTPKPLDFVLEMQQSDQPCAQKTMIKKAPPMGKGPPKNIAE